MSFLRRFAPRGSRLPSERDWERSAVLQPRLVARDPELISDGGGLPFAPAALGASPVALDPDDPAVGALIAQINAASGSRTGFSLARRRDAAPQEVPASLASWRLLARSEGEAVFGRGQPPQLLTAAVREDSRRHTWKCVAISKARPLRASRDGIRASSWRLDPSREPGPDDTELRVLVTEQTFAGAQGAEGRVLAPNLHLGAGELVLTMFVAPRPGFQARAPNPETPVRVALPEPVSTRRLVDGALYEPG